MRMPGCRAACSAVMDRSARGSQLRRPRQATASPGMSPAWVNPSGAGRDVIGSAQVNKKEPGRAVETEGPRGASGPAGMLAGVGRLARCGWPGGAPREARALKDLRFRRRSCGARWIEACACAQDADPPFVPSGPGNAAQLLPPSSVRFPATVAGMSDDDEWTPGDVTSMIANPFYAINIDEGLAVPHEPLISEDDWVKPTFA